MHDADHRVSATGVHVKKFFGVPLLIFEIEGSKDVWGCNQQEGKAMHEVVSALFFVPQCFLVFMYPRHFAFWHAEKDPSHACIKIKCELMQITDANTGIRGALCIFMEKITGREWLIRTRLIRSST